MRKDVCCGKIETVFQLGRFGQKARIDRIAKIFEQKKAVLKVLGKAARGGEAKAAKMCRNGKKVGRIVALSWWSVHQDRGL